MRTLLGIFGKIVTGLTSAFALLYVSVACQMWYQMRQRQQLAKNHSEHQITYLMHDYRIHVNGNGGFSGEITLADRYGKPVLTKISASQCPKDFRFSAAQLQANIVTTDKKTKLNLTLTCDGKLEKHTTVRGKPPLKLPSGAPAVRFSPDESFKDSYLIGSKPREEDLSGRLPK